MIRSAAEAITDRFDYDIRLCASCARLTKQRKPHGAGDYSWHCQDDAHKDTAASAALALTGAVMAGMEPKTAEPAAVVGDIRYERTDQRQKAIDEQARLKAMADMAAELAGLELRAERAERRVKVLEARIDAMCAIGAGKGAT